MASEHFNGDLDLDLDLSLELDTTEEAVAVNHSANLLDDINSLLASLTAIPVDSDNTQYDMEDFLDCEPSKSFMAEDGQLQVHSQIEIPDNCIMVSHNRSPKLIVSILQSLVSYFKADEFSVVTGPICIENNGEFIASDTLVDFNADLLSTLLSLNESFSEDVQIRFMGKTYPIYSLDLLSKFLCA